MSTLRKHEPWLWLLAGVVFSAVYLITGVTG